MPSMTFKYSEDTDKILEELREYFGVQSKADAIRRALAIARTVRKDADDDKVVRIHKDSDKDGEKDGEIGLLLA